jgi:hypothetical protein
LNARPLFVIDIRGGWRIIRALTGHPNRATAGSLPDDLAGALRLLLDEVEEEAAFEDRFGRPLKDLSIEELCAATYHGMTVGESWPKRPRSDNTADSNGPGNDDADARQQTSSGPVR